MLRLHVDWSVWTSWLVPADCMTLDKTLGFLCLHTLDCGTKGRDRTVSSGPLSSQGSAFLRKLTGLTQVVGVMGRSCLLS